ncbi:MAG: ribonuclease HII, partial [Cognaticolwellia sp.]
SGHITGQSVVKGDARVAEISAASILAKVARDGEMVALDKLYPYYGFAQHKGYPTKAHLEKIIEHGVLDCYRKSFKPVANVLANAASHITNN